MTAEQSSPQDVQKAVRRGRSEQRGEAYSVPYVEPLSDARTKLADFFNILQAMARHYTGTLLYAQ